MHIGICYGHNATVAVIHDGRLVFCQSEERLNRIKNSTGFPTQTLAYVYDHVCFPDEIESVTLFEASIFGYLHLKARNFESYQYDDYLSPEIRNNGLLQRLMRSDLGWWITRLRIAHKESNQTLRAEARAYFRRELGIPDNKLFEIKHHLSHAYSVLPSISDWPEALIFTLDGQGDWVSATVNIYRNGKLESLAEDDHRNSLGYYYSAITALLGMRPGEHEFKVMGLAPYAKPHYYDSLLRRLRSAITIDGAGRWQSAVNPSKLIETLGQYIRGYRFDSVAGAIQELTESLTHEWVSYWMRKAGISNIALAGGVFMNVKVCQKLAADPTVERLFVVPSAADESTAIGCAVWGATTFSPDVPIQPIKDLYLGMAFSDQQVEVALADACAHERYIIARPDNINHEVARLLADNEVVARCSGKMEFGARALGNRSILANPSRFENLELINTAIKSRDFWMPFTPSIIEEDMPRYIVGYEKIFAPYMCITFDSTSEAKTDLKAAIHPRDQTVRPQCVIESWNPDYYQIIFEFKRLTGIGGVLNTSFNLHGEPNVCSPRDAIYTLDNSGLRHLALGPYLLSKKSI